MGVVKVIVTFYFFMQISVNISKQYKKWKINRKSYMAYQMVAKAVTLNDLEGHYSLADVFKCNPSNICADTISTDVARRAVPLQ